MLGACTEPVGPSVDDNVRIRPEWVTGNAAAAVDPMTGTFASLLPTTSVLDVETVEELADGFLLFAMGESALGNAREGAEFDRGAPISWGSLRRCGRLTYAVSPIGTVPSTAPPAYRRAFSHRWAAPRCGRDGSVHLSLGVVDVPAETLVDVPASQWSEIDSLSGRFSVTGIPVRFPTGLPLTPERAVEYVHRETGIRVSEVPIAFNQYSAPWIGELPPCASWRITLESAVTLRRDRDGQTVESREVYVRHAPACFSSAITMYVAVLPHPTERWMHFPDGAVDVIDSVLVPVTGPLEFERVRASK